MTSIDIKTHKHSLFIFASCGTALQPAMFQGNSSDCFAYSFGDYINKESEVFSEETFFYKITTIGANNKANLFWDDEKFKGKAKTDGVFKKIEKLYKISKQLVYDEGIKSWWTDEKEEDKHKKIPHYETRTELIKTRITDLGKRIDVVKITKEYDPEDISI